MAYSHAIEAQHRLCKLLVSQANMHKVKTPTTR